MNSPLIPNDATSQPESPFVANQQVKEEPAEMAEKEYIKLVGDMPDSVMAKAFPEWDLLPPQTIAIRKPKAK
jgi:hypothetical protein